MITIQPFFFLISFLLILHLSRQPHHFFLAIHPLPYSNITIFIPSTSFLFCFLATTQIIKGIRSRCDFFSCTVVPLHMYLAGFPFFRRPFSGGVDTAKQDFENGWYVVVSKVRDRLVVALLSSPSVSLLLWV